MIPKLNDRFTWKFITKTNSTNGVDTSYTSGTYNEILLILQQTTDLSPIVATIVCTGGKTSSTPIRAIYRTDDNSLRYAEFVRSTGKLKVSTNGYETILYAR